MPEIALFHLLQKMVGDRYVICPKVALTDILTIVRPNENVHYYNKMFRKHVDFLLCDPKTFKPALAVELVKSIVRTETRATDQFMEELFANEGIPLVHIPLGENYEVSDLVNLFTIAVTKTKDMPHPTIHSAEDFVPMCPVCGKMMVLRIHRDGANAGKKYYGCMDSPRCAGLVAID
jgi:formate dehydrogenase maturation protein FdhE